MDFMTSIKTCLSKYADFNGRARRSEFWWFVLAIWVGSLVFRIINVPVLGLVWSLALLVPELAAGSRRLHDTGKSGWLQLLWLIPVLGWIPLIVFYAQEGVPGDNQYGPNPKGVGGEGLATPPAGYGPPPTS